MRIFRIKWELILAIILGFLAIIGFDLLTDEILGCIMEIILVFAFTSWIVIYKDIQKARHLLLQNWK